MFPAAGHFPAQRFRFHSDIPYHSVALLYGLAWSVAVPHQPSLCLYLSPPTPTCLVHAFYLPYDTVLS